MDVKMDMEKPSSVDSEDLPQVGLQRIKTLPYRRGTISRFNSALIRAHSHGTVVYFVP